MCFTDRYDKMIKKKDFTEGKGMRKIEKKDLAAALVFGLFIGIVNIFSHKVLEIDFYNEDLLKMEFKDFRWFFVGILLGTLCYMALLLINRNCNYQKSTGITFQRKCFWFTFALTMISWSLQLLANNPCFLMGDTTYIIEYGMGMAVQHPFLYVLFIAGGVHFFSGLTGSISWGLMLLTWVQILICALAASFIIYWLAKKGFSKTILTCLILYYSFLPIIGHYSISLVKDTLFGYFIALTSITFYEMIVTEKWLYHPRHILMLIISFVGTMAIRNNGFYIILVLLVIALILADLKSKILVSGFIIGCLLLNHDWSYGNLVQEKLGIPLQQVAYTLVKNENTAPEDIDVLENLFPLERWKESYSPMAVDTIKWSDDFNRYWLNNHEQLFMKTWRHMAKGNLKGYITAWLYQTYGIWNTIISANDSTMSAQSVFGPDPDYVYTLPKTGAQQQAAYIPILPEPLAVFIRNIFSYINYLGAGQCLWLTIACGWMSLSRKDKRGILIILPVLGVTGTLFLSTPLSTAFRYSFCYVITLPVILCVLNSCFHKQTTGEN